jgi:hypothetical protein
VRVVVLLLLPVAVDAGAVLSLPVDSGLDVVSRIGIVGIDGGAGRSGPSGFLSVAGGPWPHEVDTNNTNSAKIDDIF